MATQVKVRSLTRSEGNALVRLLHHGKDAIAVRRAEVVLASEQGDSVTQIARRLHFTADYVRKILHAFNQGGLATLKAQYENGGRPKEVLEEHESEVVELALTPPRLLGKPFTHWTLATLREEAARRRLTPKKLSLETVRQILKKHRVTLQRSKTWKESNDPQFEVKKTPSNASTARRRKAKSK